MGIASRARLGEEFRERNTGELGTGKTCASLISWKSVRPAGGGGRLLKGFKNNQLPPSIPSFYSTLLTSS